jgi:hypothetical protein
MKFAALYDLQHEINRLFIAGSKFAKNDPRLQKQAAVFNKSGDKSPVFKKIAEGIENLVNAETSDASTKLLELSTFLYAVLYTQGETVDTEQQESNLIPVLQLEDVATEKSYQVIKHLIELLTVQKDGRTRYAKAAFEHGLFNDFRIYHLLDAALDDHYTEFADYIENTVIPAVGKPIIPFIINGFSYDGKMGDVRRFRILHKSGYPKIPEMVHEILASKSGLLQIEAVKTLSDDVKNEELLIKFTDDKQKAVRLAAYKALANLNTEAALRTLVELFVAGKKKTDIAELGEILKITLPDKFIPTLLEKAKDCYATCLKLDKSADIKTVTDAFKNLTTGMNPLINNINEDIINFYKDMFTSKKYHDLSKTVKSKISHFQLPDSIADSVAKSLENRKEGFDCLKFLSKNSSWDVFRIPASKHP